MTLFENKLVVLNYVFLYQFLILNFNINLLGYTFLRTFGDDFKQGLWFLFY